LTVSIAAVASVANRVSTDKHPTIKNRVFETALTTPLCCDVTNVAFIVTPSSK